MTAGQLVRKLSSLSARAWQELLQAQLALLFAQLAVRTRPAGRLVSAAEPGPPQPLPGDPDPRALRLAVAINRAARYGVFRPLCLVRALALQRMLEGRGIAGSRIRIGVRRAGASFDAHAWVEYGPTVLADTLEHVSSFAQLGDVRMFERR